MISITTELPSAVVEMIEEVVAEESEDVTIEAAMKEAEVDRKDSVEEEIYHEEAVEEPIEMISREKIEITTASTLQAILSRDRISRTITLTATEITDPLTIITNMMKIIMMIVSAEDMVAGVTEAEAEEEEEEATPGEDIMIKRIKISRKWEASISDCN